MPDAVITRAGLRCSRCGWLWTPRGGKRPAVCSRCKRTDWDVENRVAGRQPTDDGDTQ